MSYTENEKIVLRNVEEEMRESYLRYSMSVIIARALPDVRDGLKPSQRRILYAMRQLNLGPNSKHRKCAKISGDTSGDYHPHGEGVIYPTLVRLAQDWVMRYRLVDGQGNFGSIDGDPPAAMRYTEARMTASAMLLMEDLEKDTVDHQPNYDETKTEPVVFPAKLPNLLANGSSGIAVGMATNIPPHNLSELVDASIAVLENPGIAIDDLIKIMPGPDFPTGALILGYKGILDLYHRGHGKIILRAVIEEEQDPKNDRTRLVVKEIPYNVNKSRLIETIADLVNDKTIPGISDIRDESDKDGLRIAIELKRNEIPEVVINQLLKHTELSTTIGCHFLALDKGLPRVMNVRQIIQCWIEHRIEVIRRRTRFELDKSERRAHILEGYLKAIDHMDQIVKMIRASDSKESARTDLIELFSFSTAQANAILDLRLYMLTALERTKTEEEFQSLLQKIQEWKAILADEKLVRAIIKEELLDVKRLHKGERRTRIIPYEGDLSMEDLIANESCVVTISEDDYIKRMPASIFKEQKRGGQGVSGASLKEEDKIKRLISATSHDTLLLFTNFGRVYWLKAWQIPEAQRKAKGRPLVNFLEDIREGEKVAAVLPVSSFEQDACIFFATRRGVVKKTRLEDFKNPRRKGVWAIEIDEGDELLKSCLVAEGQEMMLFTHQGNAVRFNESQVRATGRQTRGVKGVTLKTDTDYIVGCEAISTPEESVLIVCENGFGKRSSCGDFRLTNRGSQGVRSIITSDRNGNVIAALTVTDEDSVVLMSDKGQTVRISMQDVRVMGRSTQGVRLLNLKETDALVAVEKVAANPYEENGEENGEEDGEKQPLSDN